MSGYILFRGIGSKEENPKFQIQKEISRTNEDPSALNKAQLIRKIKFLLIRAFRK